ncbi:glycosyl hydrolase [candidate division KSB1 bacterium]|nr:alpha-L-fucosidase [candidate division KSB1 bacterium]RQV99742.1 MAG: glycosyl hydrolase [candidate division KSB1 bacterium]
MKRFILFFFALATLLQLLAAEDHMAWWREARFGLFIHWGLYAIPAGEWQGERIPGISEWIMLRAQIPVADYEALAQQFNPIKYDADAWVSLAKEAGMKYIVITSKHHDGFAMYHSQVNPYNIVDATPFDRDPLKELAEACKKHGLKLGFYHSQAQDWNHPGGSYRGYPKEPHWDKTMQRVPFEQYIEEKAYPQVKEILSNYGDIAIMWWDTPMGMTEPMAEKLNTLLELQPGIIANNRLYGPWRGDFSTPEQHIPPTGLDYDWETCMTMNTSWGYKWYDDDWKSTETLIQYLADIASKGGNFLLNVGPTAEGEIPAPSIERLKGIGAWMTVNGESIYGTTASPFFKLPWGRCTKKVDENSATLYLHVFDWPKNGKLPVAGLKSNVTSARLLADGQALTWTTSDNDVIINVPEQAPDAVNSVIVLDIDGVLDVESNMPRQAENGTIILPAPLAFIHNRGYSMKTGVSDNSASAYITDWESDRTYIEWIFEVLKPGTFQIIAEAACDQKTELTIKFENQQVAATIQSTGGPSAFEKIVLGELMIKESGQQVIQVNPVREYWKPLNLRTLILKSAQ